MEAEAGVAEVAGVAEEDSQLLTVSPNYTHFTSPPSPLPCEKRGSNLLVFYSLLFTNQTSLAPYFLAGKVAGG